MGWGLATYLAAIFLLVSGTKLMYKSVDSTEPVTDGLFQEFLTDSFTAEPDPDEVTEPAFGESRKSNKHKDKDKEHIIVVNQEDQYDWTPPCRGANEVFSSSIKCDVRCDFGDDNYHHGYDEHDDYGYGYGNGHGYYRADKEFLRNMRCSRTVSDYLIENGVPNVLTRADVGAPPETPDEYAARTIDLHALQMLKNSINSHNNDDKYVIVQQKPTYRPPPGRCICRKGFARYKGRCVRFGQCPRKYLFYFSESLSSLIWFFFA